jgi:hypothetical protein
MTEPGKGTVKEFSRRCLLVLAGALRIERVSVGRIRAAPPLIVNPPLHQGGFARATHRSEHENVCALILPGLINQHKLVVPAKQRGTGPRQAGEVKFGGERGRRGGFFWRENDGDIPNVQLF